MNIPFEFQVPELPKVEEISFLVKNYWNKGVMASFVFLSDLPNKTAKLSKQGYEYVLRQLEQSQQKSTSTTKSQETSK
jgi:hypothetical protein